MSHELVVTAVGPIAPESRPTSRATFTPPAQTSPIREW